MVRLLSRIKKILLGVAGLLLVAALAGASYQRLAGRDIGNQPELVVKAIREVLLAARDEDRKPGC